MLFLCIILISFVQSHNWIHSRSRAYRASTLQPAPPKPSTFQPHLRVGQNQKFGFEWASGHGDSYYYFVVTHAKHEDKLKQHTLKNLKAYVDEAPKSAEVFTGPEWQKRHTSCGFSNMCNNKKGKNDGRDYLKQLHEGDNLYFDRPAVWFNEGIAQFQYKASDLVNDKRVSYTNPKWPWIEAVHSFQVKHPRPREWDISEFKIEGKEGPGPYLIHMVWRGYRDVIDVDVIAGTSPDIYGSPSESDSSWTRIDHCQYKPSNYNGKNSRCYIIDNTARDVSKCLDFCSRTSKKGKAKCKAVNVVPLKNPSGVTHFDSVNTPASTKCDRLTSVKEDAMVCYGVKPIENSKQNDDVDELWTVIPDDPEDPIFYSTCYNLQQGWTFQGYQSSSSPQQAPISQKVGDQCLTCSDVDKIKSLKTSQVPAWKIATECTKCY